MDTHLAFHLTETGTAYQSRLKTRHNGTQSFDGWFPRFFSEPQYAKSSLTKFLGESLVWEEDSSNAL
ncbi:hypothetical protein VEE68_51980 (plasmid) [Escherichia coli]|nr:hypothetical protein VEE68_51980 [Escherichia coli]